jgi:hypothetical protein
MVVGHSIPAAQYSSRCVTAADHQEGVADARSIQHRGDGSDGDHTTNFSPTKFSVSARRFVSSNMVLDPFLVGFDEHRGRPARLGLP